MPVTIPSRTSPPSISTTKCLCSPSPQGKNLVVCIDGTANQFSEKNSNVVELYSRLVKDKSQLTYYNSGIGTYVKDSKSWKSWFSFRAWNQSFEHTIDEAVAWNFKQKVLNAYQWLSENYEDGDQIFLFGFSRGAYQIRVIAGMVKLVGLLYKGNNDQIPFAYELYVESISNEKHASELPKDSKTLCRHFKQTLSRPNVVVHFVGAWDTVSSIGIFRGRNLPETTGMNHVCNFRHALALDELRVKFLPEYANGGAGPDAPNSSVNHIKEVWFAGSHSDIGGGNIPNLQSNRFGPALRWMSYEAINCGLKMQPHMGEWSPITPSDSMTFFWKIFEYIPLSRLSYRTEDSVEWWPPHRERSRQVQKGQLIHESVLNIHKEYEPKARIYDDETRVTLDWDKDVLENRKMIEKDPYARAGEVLDHLVEFNLMKAEFPPADVHVLSSLASNEIGCRSIIDVPKAHDILTASLYNEFERNLDPSKQSLTALVKALAAFPAPSVRRDVYMKLRESMSSLCIQQPSIQDAVFKLQLKLSALPCPFALIIGINKYKSPNIPNLLGAVPDADAVRDYLENYLGVPSSQIRNLRDSEATRAAILEEIKAFSSNNKIRKGFPILIYYAGHGASADTPKGWDGNNTGKIELLVPYDHSSSPEDDNGKHGIPDRTLGALLSHLASEKGDNITVILDCCHSGSGTRSLPDPTLKARGIDVGNIPSNLDQDIWSAFESLKDVKRESEVHFGFARKGLKSHVLKSHVLLAACRPQELAYERTSRGVFTKALLKTLVDNGIDRLTYTTLFNRMPSLSSGQSPQCEGFSRNRLIFNGKASHGRTACYKIRKSEGEETYVIPDAGEAAGVSLGAEFEVYQNQYSGHLLGTVVARKINASSTTLYAKDSIFALERDGVAFKSCAGTEEQLRIHVADESLKDLVKKLDQIIIQLVERDRAEFGIALEDGRVVFNIYDSEITKYGLTRMPHTLEPTLEAISPVIRAAAHFYWHLRRRPQTDRGLATKVEIEVTVLKQKSVGYDNELNPVIVYGPTGDWKGGKHFDLQTETSYGWRIINKCAVPLYPALFYFDNSDWSITPYFEPPIAQGINKSPLIGNGYLTVGYGDSGLVPYEFVLPEGQNVDVGILKLFLSTEQVDLSHVAQSSPFFSGHSTVTAQAQSRGSAPPNLKLTLPQWNTLEIPVVKRDADK